ENTEQTLASLVETLDRSKEKPTFNRFAELRGKDIKMVFYEAKQYPFPSPKSQEEAILRACLNCASIYAIDKPTGRKNHVATQMLGIKTFPSERYGLESLDQTLAAKEIASSDHKIKPQVAKATLARELFRSMVPERSQKIFLKTWKVIFPEKNDGFAIESWQDITFIPRQRQVAKYCPNHKHLFRFLQEGNSWAGGTVRVSKDALRTARIALHERLHHQSKQVREYDEEVAEVLIDYASRELQESTTPRNLSQVENKTYLQAATPIKRFITDLEGHGYSPPKS
ncbi:hypothetical protein ACFLZP_03760, partial [Patescibacteria group bacterium]